MPTVKTIRALLTVASELLDELEDGTDAPSREVDTARCPRCGEGEKTENTSTVTQRRLTCLTCGTSWAPGVGEEKRNG